MNIRLDDLQGPQIVQLIQEHLLSMAEQSPPESVHALGLEALRRPDVTLWSVWSDSELMGCGALKELDARHGEIKSMRTAAQHRRKGVAAHLLRHLLAEAKQRSYRRLSLETGPQDSFAAARNLYASSGFQYCAPFAEYIEDPKRKTHQHQRSEIRSGDEPPRPAVVAIGSERRTSRRTH
jgi:putative acetyltransferase